MLKVEDNKDKTQSQPIGGHAVLSPVLLRRQLDPLQKPPTYNEIVKGLLLFMACLVLFCIQTLVVKITLTKFQITAFELAYQFCTPLVLISYLTMKRSVPKDFDFLQIPRKMFWPLLGRCMCGFLSDVTLYLAFTYTSYSKAFCVHKMESLFSPFIAFYTLGETVKSADLIGVVLGFGGMLLMLQPWSSQEQNSLETDIIGFVWALLGAVVSAWLFVFCRMISNTFHYTVPLFFYMQLSCLSTPLVKLFTPDTRVGMLPIYSLELYLYVAAIFTLFYVHVLLFSASWKYNTVGTSAVLIYMCIPITYLMDLFFIGRTMNLTEVSGAGLIFVTNVSIVGLRLLKYIN
jgi:drug/metabolite transporter (DMT)-like permease